MIIGWYLYLSTLDVIIVFIYCLFLVGFCINDHSNDEETGNYTRVVDSCQTNCTFTVENEMQLVPTNSTGYIHCKISTIY